MTARQNARRDLEWLQVVGAVRRIEETNDGSGYVVELPTRELLALPAEEVAAFRRGVLVGWRLPRESSRGGAA